MDNLEAQTYETFEKDAVKYIQVWLIVSSVCRNLVSFFSLRNLFNSPPPP